MSMRNNGRGRLWCKYILTRLDNLTGLDEYFPPNLPFGELRQKNLI